MTIQGVLETCLYVDDLQEAEQFYTEVLGLQLFSSADNRHLFFRCGRAVFLLFDPGKTGQEGGSLPPHGTRGPGHVAFSVDATEIDRWCQRLVDHGVELESVVTWPGGERSLYFRDPAGNSLELVSPTIWGL